MRSGLNWVILGLGLVAAVAASGTVSNYDDFENTLRVNGTLRLEAALGFLPAAHWSNYTLIHSSKSSQGAKAHHPRVLLFGADASFVVAFNGHPDAEGYDTLEIMQFREPTQSFELRRIRFPTKANKLALPDFSKANPPACLRCHRADPRPNWGGYPRWPGVYGSDDDGMPDAEKADYFEFVAKHSAGERYRRLARPAGSRLSPYSPRGMGTIAFRPNLLLTKLLARRNANRIAHRLLSSLSGRDRAVAPLLLLGCSPLSDAAWGRIAASLGYGAENWKKVRDEVGHYHLRLRLLERSCLTPDDWTLEFLKRGQSAHPVEALSYFDGVNHISQLVDYRLIRRLADVYPELEPVAIEDYYAYDETLPEAKRRVAAVKRLGSALDQDVPACAALEKTLLAP